MKEDKKKVFIKNFGCQMNEHDSGRVKDFLVQDGYCVVESPDDADAVLFNTCSVRKHAEDRVFNQVGLLKGLKKKRPEVVLGVLGCMAEAQKDSIFRKFPYVNFLCGPADLDKVPEIVRRIRNGAGRIICLEGYRTGRIPGFSKERSVGKSAYVKIMEGCSNFCSYCVVPYVRGLERSRPSKEILEEIKGLINKGVEKITLLGQNVNSYGRGLKEKIDFSELLRRVKGVEVGFMTSHPKDASIELFRVMAESDSISKNLHLPLQSGSNKILKRMNRNYTIEKYKKLVRDFRKIVRGSSLTTDLIVGFPGESEKDFEDTLRAVKEIRFNAAYIFKYSPRPFTKASEFKDDVPKKEKERRHALLLETQKRISLGGGTCFQLKAETGSSSKRKQVPNGSTVYFLVGPTASGKTGVSLRLAEKLGAEIVSCDSMCVYKGMNILTSKPSKADRKKVRHHLVDIVSPTKEFSVAEYRELALRAIEDILRRGKTPLFVGGSGLYVKSVVDGLFPSTKKDVRFRNRQKALIDRYGKNYLYNKLKRIDPVIARKLHPNDLRRIVRALEIYHTERKKPSELKEKTQPLKYKVKILGLKVDRKELYRNIDNRVEEMFGNGIVQEVKKLSKKNLSLTAKKALGYNEVLGYLQGKYSLEEAKESLKKNTRNFAKRQMTWFRADPRIAWNLFPAQLETGSN